jgi:hypothetical protein
MLQRIYKCRGLGLAGVIRGENAAEEPVGVAAVSGSRQALRERIPRLEMSRAVVEVDHTEVVVLADEVGTAVDVLGAVMLAVVLTELDAGLVVLVQDSGIRLNMAEVGHEKAEVDGHLGCVSSGDVFGHTGGVGEELLAAGAPGDGGVAE